MCMCGHPLADFFVLAMVTRPLADGVMETGRVDEYFCRKHFPTDSDDLLSDELLDDGWQVYSITVGSLMPTVLH